MSETIAISVVTVAAWSALLSLLMNVVRAVGDSGSADRGDSMLLEQVSVARVLRDAPGALNRGELFASLADVDHPQPLARLDRILGDLERGGVIVSDVDAETGERSWRLPRSRGTLDPPA